MMSSRVLRSLLAATALGLATTGVRAAETFSLGGHTLGLPYDSVLNDPAYDCESLAGCFLFSACAYRDTGTVAFHGVPLEGLTLYFTGERLSGIAADFEESRFDQVADVLAQEYGPGTVEAGTGATKAISSSAVLVWRQGSKLLRLERSSKIARSTVILAERNFISELVERP